MFLTHEELTDVSSAMNLIYGKGDELNGHMRRVLRRLSERICGEGTIAHVGGRGMDHYTDAQVESSIRSMNYDLEGLWHEINALQKREREILDSLASAEEEARERALDEEIEFYLETEPSITDRNELK